MDQSVSVSLRSAALRPSSLPNPLLAFTGHRGGCWEVGGREVAPSAWAGGTLIASSAISIRSTGPTCRVGSSAASASLVSSRDFRRLWSAASSTRPPRLARRSLCSAPYFHFICQGGAGHGDNVQLCRWCSWFHGASVRSPDWGIEFLVSYTWECASSGGRV